MAEVEIASPTQVAKPDAISTLPADALIIIPVRNLVLFPGMVSPIAIGRPRSVAAAQQAVREQRQVGILLQRDEADEPAPAELYRIGTTANVVRYITAPDGTHHIVCQGEQRFQVVDFLNEFRFLAAHVQRLTEADFANLGRRGALSAPAAPSA